MENLLSLCPCTFRFKQRRLRHPYRSSAFQDATDRISGIVVAYFGRTAALHSLGNDRRKSFELGSDQLFRRSIIRAVPFASYGAHPRVVMARFLDCNKSQHDRNCRRRLFTSSHYFYVANRIWAYALFATLTVLTRETSVVIFIGIFCREFLQRKSFHYLAARGFPIVIYVLWRDFLTHLWHMPLEANDIVAWPLLGLIQAIGAAFLLPELRYALYVLAGMSFIVAFCVVVALSNLKNWREPLVFGWFALLGLMSSLSARGPWIEPIGFSFEPSANAMSSVCFCCPTT